MRKISAGRIVIVLLLAAAVVAVVRSGQVSDRNPNEATNGAFRDGMYQAKLDAELGRKPFLRSGRWTSDADRASFISGYEREYNRLFARTAGRNGSHPAELMGFRDGISDAAEDRRAARPFALRSAEVFHIAQKRSGNDSNYAGAYLQAYANGYQHGYYAPQETLESEVLDAKSRQF